MKLSSLTQTLQTITFPQGNRQVSLSDLSAQLKSEVSDARQWLLGLGEAIVRHKPAADRWTIAEVIGHLVDSASNNHQRFIRAQEVDALVFPKYQRNSWAEKNDYASAGWESLVELWYHYNLQLARVIINVPDSQLATQCSIGDNEPCTLEFLITDYVEHLQHHLKKIRERVEGAERRKF
jgi:hypothetical protein